MARESVLITDVGGVRISAALNWKQLIGPKERYWSGWVKTVDTRWTGRWNSRSWLTVKVSDGRSLIWSSFGIVNWFRVVSGNMAWYEWGNSSDSMTLGALEPQKNGVAQLSDTSTLKFKNMKLQVICRVWGVSQIWFDQVQLLRYSGLTLSEIFRGSHVESILSESSNSDKLSQVTGLSELIGGLQYHRFVISLCTVNKEII